MIELPRLEARRYLQPLREGGSLPAIVETDGGVYVVKFRGAGQGPRALIAELVAGLIARQLELPVPDLATVIVPDEFTDERDAEIRDLILASRGMNIGIRYLDGAFNYDERAAGDYLSQELASGIVWLDAFLTNPDRTARNPNLMIWNRRPWLIDHGSALYAHHNWGNVDEGQTRTPFPMIREHLLLLRAEGVKEADERMVSHLTEDRLCDVLNAVPDELLMDPLARGPFQSADEARARYVRYLLDRLRPPRLFVEEIERARSVRRSQPVQHLEVRR